MEGVGAVAAPVTIASALGYYIGVVRQDTLARHFGLDVSLLAFSPQDYVLRSVDALIPFLVGLSIAALLLLAVSALVWSWLRSQPPSRRRHAASVVAAGGSLAVGLGVWRLPHPVPLGGWYLAGPISLTLGAVLLAASGPPLLQQHLRPAGSPQVLRWGSAVAATATTVLALAGLFWAANDYARAQGKARALQLEQSLSVRPGAVVHSSTPLHIEAPGVNEEELDVGNGSVTFRYQGLRLLIHSGGKYFLLPDSWSSQTGTAIVLPDNDALRIDFTPGGAA